MDLIIVANIEQSNFEVDKRQIRDIFMGNSSEFDLTPLALSPDNQVRTLFNTKVIGLTESRIQSYWAQMRFSGRRKPPKEIENTEALLQQLLSIENTIAYLPADVELPEGLIVVYRMK